MTDLERFTLRLCRAANGCLEWQGARNRGYGAFWFAGRVMRAHRFAYKLAYGPLSELLEINHRCRNRACVEPTHLQALTPEAHKVVDHDYFVESGRRMGPITGHSGAPKRRGRMSSLNTSGFPNVTFEKTRGNWRGNFRFEGRSYMAGRYATPQEAAAAVINLRTRLEAERV